VEPEEDRLRFDALDAEADEMRDPIGGIAVEGHAANPRRGVVRDAVRELALRTRFGGEPTVGRNFGGGGAEADHGRDVLEPTAPAGWIVPTSWLAICTVTSAVSGRTASSTAVGS